MAPQKTGVLPWDASVMAGALQSLNVCASGGLHHAPHVQMHTQHQHLHVPASAAYAKPGRQRGGRAAVCRGGFSSNAGGPSPVGPCHSPTRGSLRKTPWEMRAGTGTTPALRAGKCRQGMQAVHAEGTAGCVVLPRR